jgi:hypothetical protein
MASVKDSQVHAAWAEQGRELRDLEASVSGLKFAINDALALDDVDAIKARLREAVEN